MQPLVCGSPPTAPALIIIPGLSRALPSPHPAPDHLDAMRPTVAPSQQPTSFQPWAGFSLTRSKPESYPGGPRPPSTWPSPPRPPESPGSPSPLCLCSSVTSSQGCHFLPSSKRPGSERVGACRALEQPLCPDRGCPRSPEAVMWEGPRQGQEGRRPIWCSNSSQ